MVYNRETGGEKWLRKTMNVNAPTAASGMGIARLVRSTTGKTAPAQIAVKPEKRTKNRGK
jgi:hypothetical protein